MTPWLKRGQCHRVALSIGMVTAAIDATGALRRWRQALEQARSQVTALWRPIVLAGDFNVAPNGIDIFIPTNGSSRFGITCGDDGNVMLACGSIIFSSTPTSRRG